MIMTPMTLIIVSAVADGKTRGAATRISGERQPWRERAELRVMISRVPMRPVGRTIRTRTSRR